MLYRHEACLTILHIVNASVFQCLLHWAKNIIQQLNPQYIFCSNQFAISVDCEWSRFSDWSECSVSCGGGIQRRRRTVLVEAERGGRRCIGRTEETRICNSKICPTPAGENLINCQQFSIFCSLFLPKVMLKISLITDERNVIISSVLNDNHTASK